MPTVHGTPSQVRDPGAHYPARPSAARPRSPPWSTSTRAANFPDNYPALLLSTVEQLPAALRRRLNQETAGEKTGLFDTP